MVLGVLPARVLPLGRVTTLPGLLLRELLPLELLLPELLPLELLLPELLLELPELPLLELLLSSSLGVVLGEAGCLVGGSMSGVPSLSKSISTTGLARTGLTKVVDKKVRHDARIITMLAKIGKVLCLLLYVISVINIT